MRIGLQVSHSGIIGRLSAPALSVSQSVCIPPTLVSSVLTTAFKHEDATAAPQNALGGGVLSAPVARQYASAARPWMPVARPTCARTRSAAAWWFASLSPKSLGGLFIFCFDLTTRALKTPAGLFQAHFQHTITTHSQRSSITLHTGLLSPAGRSRRTAQALCAAKTRLCCRAARFRCKINPQRTAPRPRRSRCRRGRSRAGVEAPWRESARPHRAKRIRKSSN